jgi:hypothetical protein
MNCGLGVHLQTANDNYPRISHSAGSANSHRVFVIAPRGEMVSFPIGTTPFLPEIESARGSSVQEIPRAPNDAGDKRRGR